MNTVFGELIGWTVVAYVDDIIVKLKHANSIIMILASPLRHLRLRMLSSILKNVFLGSQGACC
jgi:hypothetical protein